MNCKIDDQSRSEMCCNSGTKHQLHFMCCKQKDSDSRKVRVKMQETPRIVPNRNEGLFASGSPRLGLPIPMQKTLFVKRPSTTQKAFVRDVGPMPNLSAHIRCRNAFRRVTAPCGAQRAHLRPNWPSYRSRGCSSASAAPAARVFYPRDQRGHFGPDMVHAMESRTIASKLEASTDLG